MTGGDLVGRAVAAARTAGARAGVEAGAAAPIGTGSNVIVLLRPHPVVARVMTGTVVLHPDPGEWLRRELHVARHLAGRGAPVVRPLGEPEAGPYCVDGLWLSLWEHVDTSGPHISAGEAGRTLRQLHDALADYAGELPARSAVGAEIDRLLATVGEPDVTAADLAALRAERDRLAPVITRTHAAEQALHGDVSLGNLLSTPLGPRFNDLEDVCRGWVGWDLASMVEDVRLHHGERGVAALLDGYGDGPALAELEPLIEVTHLYGVLWLLHLAPRGGDTRRRATARLDAWKRR